MNVSEAKKLVEEALESIYQKTEDYCRLCGAKEYPVCGDMKGYDNVSVKEAEEWNIDHLETCPVTKITQALAALDEPKCELCGDTGKPCNSCGEFHSSDVMCPPHEVRSKGKGSINAPCPRCGRRPCQTCGGRREVDDTIRSVRAGIDINKPCPDCQKPVIRERDEPDKLLKTCPKCKRIEALSWDARAKVYTCLYCSYTERPNVCQMCGGSGEIFIEKRGDTYFTDPLGKGKPCPKCQLKSGEGERDEPEQQSGEFIEKMWKRFYEWAKLAPHQDTTLDYALSGYQKALNVIEEQITELDIKTSSCEIFKKTIGFLKKDIEQFERKMRLLQDSYTSVAEVARQLEAENKQLTARIKKLEQKGE